MNIAIYSRKSKFTDKSESTDNQINICTTYCNTHFEEKLNFIIYEDEGYSGSNTNRPAFQKMNNDLLYKNINVIVCYKLDRISRDVSDFNILIKKLEKLNIDFICIKEQFDTTTPIGRAMMNISATFAQLERESIGERISDNLAELSKQGRFISSKPPFGFNKQLSNYIDKNGKEKKMNILITNIEEMKIVKLAFEKYIEFESINKVATFFINNRYKTRNGNDFSTTTIRRILTNQYYCNADKTAYNYFVENGASIISDNNNWIGKFGVCVYKRINSKTKQPNKNNKIIYSVGTHEGFISSDIWISVQNTMNKRKNSSYRKTRSSSLLSGLLKCSMCGAYMRPQSYQKNGAFYYICENKEKSCKQLCSIKNLRGDTLDKEFINQFILSIKNNNHNLKMSSTHYIKETNSINFKNDKNIINENNDKILITKKTISKLIMNMSKVSDKITIDYISKEINILNKNIDLLILENNNLKNKVYTENNNTITYKTDMTKNRILLKKIIQFAYWDGKSITVDFI